jgi:hypothetical protein
MCLFDLLILSVENICEEFWYFEFVFILTIRLEPYLTEAPTRNLRIDYLQLPPSIFPVFPSILLAILFKRML